MANTNRDILMTVDVKNSKVNNGGFSFYITDKNTSNFFVRLVMSMSTSPLISNFVSLEQASNYQIKLIVIKPNNEMKTVMATLMDETNAIFQFDLTDDFKDIIGEYKCEFWIYSTVGTSEEVITTDSFTYSVKSSILSNLPPVTNVDNPVALAFDENGDLVVTIGSITKTFTPK